MKKLHIYSDGTFAITDPDVSIEQNGQLPVQSMDATDENLKKHSIHIRVDNSKKE